MLEVQQNNLFDYSIFYDIKTRQSRNRKGKKYYEYKYNREKRRNVLLPV